MKDLKQIVSFLRAIEKLKTIERYNKTSNLARSESDAEHIWHLVMMVYLMSRVRPELDKLRLIELALIHDLVEVYAGDVRFWDEDKKSDEDKKIAENDAAKQLFELLPADEAKKMADLWDEYDNVASPEAQYVLAMDKIQPVLQRVISKDEGMKVKKVDKDRFINSKPKEIINDEHLSKLWDDFAIETLELDLIYRE